VKKSRSVWQALCQRAEKWLLEGQSKKAWGTYQKILTQDPQHLLALQNLGVLAAQVGDHQNARMYLERALAAHPASAQVAYNLGVLLGQMALIDEAIAAYTQAIGHCPGHQDARGNRAALYARQGQFEKVIADCDVLITQKPKHFGWYVNRGNAYKETGQFHLALADYDRAIALEPERAEVHWNAAFVHLMQGEWVQGWDRYEWRLKASHFNAPPLRCLAPLLQGGEDLQGKTVYIHAEQGFGDAIQFARYIPLLQAQGAQVIWSVPAELLDLFQTLVGTYHTVKWIPLPQLYAGPADYVCYLMSLPRWFAHTEPHKIPAKTPYLSSSASQRLRWQDRLGPPTRLRVGLAWSGRTTFGEDAKRSMALAEFVTALPENIDYFIVQKGIREVDQAVLMSHSVPPDSSNSASCHLRNLGEDIQDFSDTAALCALMDVVISVDTSVAHVAGALNRPVWVLLPYVPDWRWLLAREDSPWYPSARLYRQTQLGEWSDVLARIFGDLVILRQEWLSSRSLISRAAEFHTNQGHAWHEQGQCQPALMAYKQALSLEEAASSYAGRAGVLKDLKQWDAALADYDRAIALEPKNPVHVFNQGWVHLLMGQLEKGFRLYEARWETTQNRPNLPMPVWTGQQDLRGKRIFVYSEQGHGDNLQFCRYVPLLAQRGAFIILGVAPELLSVMKRLKGVCDCILPGPVPAVDFQCPLGSLPLAFGTRLETVPSQTPYLGADPLKVAEWETRLQTLTTGVGPTTTHQHRRPRPRPHRIGLVWRGRATHPNDHRRSLTLAQLLPFLPRSPAIHYVCLQKDIYPADQRNLRLNPEIYAPSKEISDFSDTAALCELMDLIISVDTSVAHLAGALGRPVWLLLPDVGDWRWLTQRTDSPWYPTMKLYRQDVTGGWIEVLGRVAQDLVTWIEKDKQTHIKNISFEMPQTSQTLQTSVDRVTALLNQADEWAEKKQNVEAQKAYEEALALQPTPRGHNNLGNLLEKMGQFDRALAHYDRAIALNPGFAGFYNNRANVLKSQGRYEEALQAHAQAMETDPDDARLQVNHGMAHLLMGQFKRGWPLYEARWGTPDFPNPKPTFTQPRWDGSQFLDGKRIFVYSEQGMGDAIQFVRYVPLLMRQGALVAMGIFDPLHPVMKASKLAHLLISPGGKVPDCDYHCPLMSLPLAFGTTLSTIPAQVPYLCTEPERVALWAARLQAHGHQYKTTSQEQRRPLRVGLAWSGSTLHLHDHRRSLTLAQLLPFLPRSPAIYYVCLQKDIRPADQRNLDLNPEIYAPSKDISDFSDTAALCELMDLVISVDTSVAHLAGALARPTWLLLSQPPEWRWLTQRTDSPWYSTMRLYRQTQPGEWKNVLQALGQDLQIEMTQVPLSHLVLPLGSEPNG
jgi:tetratricopeptide (TPR) repeat protein